MTEPKRETPAVCPMCGHENPLPPVDRPTARTGEDEAGESAGPTALQCAGCGEPLAVDTHPRRPPAAAPWEIAVATVLLVAIVVVFVVSIVLTR